MESRLERQSGSQLRTRMQEHEADWRMGTTKRTAIAKTVIITGHRGVGTGGPGGPRPPNFLTGGAWPRLIIDRIVHKTISSHHTE